MRFCRAKEFLVRRHVNTENEGKKKKKKVTTQQEHRFSFAQSFFFSFSPSHSQHVLTRFVLLRVYVKKKSL